MNGIDDPLGAFCRGEAVRIAGARQGPLAGLRFAAKDLYDVAGHVTGCGNPDWRRTHRPAEITAPAVQSLIDAGAELVGKTITDELAFSLSGRNQHYGTPVNPHARGRIPGGSSSGSASAVAGGLVDFALGTDTGGSIRVPAALCGIYGVRPSHDAISLEGVMPLAPSFDTVGWLARDAGLLGRVGDVLLPPDEVDTPLNTLLLLHDALDLAEPGVEAAVRLAARRMYDVLGTAHTVRLAEFLPPEVNDLERCMEIFRTLQGREIWCQHGEWVKETSPVFGPGVAARFAWSETITESAAAEVAPHAEAFASGMERLLSGGVLLGLPTTAVVAPRTDSGQQAMGVYRESTLSLTSLAGLAGLPQLTLPAGEAPDGDEGYPVGLSLIAGRGADRALLDLAVRLSSIL